MKRLSVFLTLPLIVNFFGCVTTTALNTDRPENILTQYRNPETAAGQKIAAPCVVQVRAADLIYGYEDSILKEANIANQYSYPLRSIVDQAFLDTVYDVFEPAEGNLDNALMLKVSVPLSQLAIKNGMAQYDFKCRAELQSPGGKTIYTEDLDRHESSRFDNVNTPDAVWNAVYGVALEQVRRISQDPAVHQAAANISQQPRLLAIECDLHCYDLRGNLLASAGASTQERGELRDTAEQMVRELLEQLPDVQELKIAVLDLKNVGEGAEKANLGSTFSGAVQTILAKNERVTIVSRTDLSTILQEHNLLSTDLIENPETLKDRDIKIERVGYLLMGRISMLMSK